MSNDETSGPVFQLEEVYTDTDTKTTHYCEKIIPTLLAPLRI